MSDAKSKGDSPEQEIRDQIKKKVEESIEQAKTNKEMVSKIDADLTNVTDIGNLYLQALPFRRPESLEDDYLIWETVSSSLGKSGAVLTAALPSNSTASGTVSIYPSILSERSAFVFGANNSQAPAIIGETTTAFSDMLKVEEEYEKAIKLIDQLGLNSASQGEHKPSDQLAIAYASYKNPITTIPIPANTSTIPLRQAVIALLHNLLLKMPRQEPAGTLREKVQVPLEQLKHEGIDASFVDIWANDWHEINKTMLSPTKSKAISRQEWRRYLFRSLNFICNVLIAVDPNKFK